MHYLIQCLLNYNYNVNCRQLKIFTFFDLFRFLYVCYIKSMVKICIYIQYFMNLKKK